jgi:hypothetical protein
MNRRDLLGEGIRYLAQVLPGMVVTAGNLGVFLRQPIEAAIDQSAACFPDQIEEVAQQTATPLPKED